MKVLSVASEIYPLVKTGGLADVAGALPPALGAQGVDMRSLVPGYPAVMAAVGDGRPVHHWPDLLGVPATLVEADHAGLTLYVLDAPSLYDRPGGPYADPSGRDWHDNWQRFAALCRAAADIAGGLMPGFHPDIVHAHDWQAGLAPVYVRHASASQARTVVTVHNIAFQGQFGADVFWRLGLPHWLMSLGGVEYYGDVGFLKGGLQAADAITTVSPTYAQEIRTPAFGMGLEGLVNGRAGALHGIVNGIDTGVWDPATDPALAQTYDFAGISGRTANKRAVEARFGLAEGDGPILSVVSRLTWQKGMDILGAALDGIVEAGARLVVLGSGDRHLEDTVRAATHRHAGRVGAIIGYDEALSHLVQGGADAILVPSRFEPCGLTQLYGLRYGCVPIVARTGGLADTVIDANVAALAAGVATGFHIAPLSVETLVHAVRRAVEIHADRPAWLSLQRNGMRQDVSWDASARQYLDLYKRLLNRS